jgi:hypothetical protein
MTISYNEFVSGMGQAPIRPSPRRLVLVPKPSNYRDGSWDVGRRGRLPAFDNRMPVATVGQWTPWGGSSFPAPGAAMESF